MPVREVGPDPNGLFYQAVTTQEWQSSYGETLRAQGYRYCGLGTWGIYVAAPEQPCWYRKTVDQEPNIGATVPGDVPVTVTGNGGAAAPLHTGGGCSGCGATEPPAAAPTVGPGLSVATVIPTMEKVFKGLPWWVYVLIGFTISQVLFKDGARG